MIQSKRLDWKQIASDPEQGTRATALMLLAESPYDAPHRNKQFKKIKKNSFVNDCICNNACH